MNEIAKQARKIYLASFLIFGLLSYGIYRYIQIEDKLQFTLESSRAHNTISNQIRSGYDVLNNLEALFTASIADIDYDSFRIATEPTLEKNKFLKSVSFSKWIKSSEASTFEQTKKESGWASFQIHGSSEKPLESFKNHFLPIVFLEPLSPSDGDRLGLNLLSDTGTKEAFIDAVENAKVVALNPRNIDENIQVVEFIKPIFSGKVIPTSVAARWESLQGALLITVDPKLLISGSSILDNFGIEVRLPLASGQPAENRWFGNPLKTPSFYYSRATSQDNLIIDKSEYIIKISENELWTFGRVAAYLTTFGLVVCGVLFAKMRLKLFFKEREKEHLQQELQIKSAVAEESEKVRILVDNMQQALFSIAIGGIIIEPVSKYTNKIFGQKVTGQKITQVLFIDPTENSEKLSALNSALDVVFGEDSIQWSLMEDNFPSKLRYQLLTEGGTEERIISIKMTPIWNDSSLLDKILVIVDDITALQKLESELNLQRKQTEMTEDILSSKFNELNSFIYESFKVINHCKLLLVNLNSENILVIKRELHTLKGNSRLFKLRGVSEQIHNSESVIIELPHEISSNALSEEILRELENISAIFSKYRAILDRFTQVSGATSINDDYNENQIKN
jgi:PAS domain-containing protein